MLNKMCFWLVAVCCLLINCTVSAQAVDLSKLVDVQNPVIFQLVNGANGTSSRMTIYNHSDRDLIINDFQTDVFKKTMLHGTKYESGKRAMFHVDRITVPAHSKLALTPNTHHLMLSDPTRHLETGEFVSLKVHTNQGEFSVIAQVVPRRLK